METRMMELALRITKLRKLRELSQDDMAKKTGVTLEKYKSYETGTKDFSFLFLCKCAHTFSMEISELLTGERIRNKATKCTSMRQRNGAEYSSSRCRNLTLTPKKHF